MLLMPTPEHARTSKLSSLLVLRHSADIWHVRETLGVWAVDTGVIGAAGGGWRGRFFGRGATLVRGNAAAVIGLGWRGSWSAFWRAGGRAVFIARGGGGLSPHVFLAGVVGAHFG